MKPWNRLWVYGWLVILAIATLYEFIAAITEWLGYTALPTLSRVIVGTIPLVILEPLTFLIALALMIHWVMVKRIEHSTHETDVEHAGRMHE